MNKASAAVKPPPSFKLAATSKVVGPASSRPPFLKDTFRQAQSAPPRADAGIPNFTSARLEDLQDAVASSLPTGIPRSARRTKSTDDRRDSGKGPIISANTRNNNANEKLSQLLALLAANPNNRCPLAPMHGGLAGGGCGVSTLSGPLPVCNHWRKPASSIMASPPMSALADDGHGLSANMLGGAVVNALAAVGGQQTGSGLNISDILTSSGSAPVGDLAKLQQLEAILSKFLSSVDPTVGRIKNVSQLSKFLNLELEKAKNVRSVAQSIHDLVNQITGQHMDPQLLHIITEMLVESVTGEVGEVEDVNEDYARNPEARSSIEPIIRLASAELSDKIERLDAHMNKEAAVTAPLPQTPRVEEDASPRALDYQQKYQQAKAEMAEWANQLSTFYETREAKMKGEFESILADLQSKIDQQGGVKETAAQIDSFRYQIKEQTELTNELEDNLREKDNQIKSLENELIIHRDIATNAANEVEKANQRFTRERKEMLDRLKEISDETESFRLFKEHLVDSLQQSAIQVHMLEDQTRKLKKEKLDAGVLKSKFQSDMVNIKDKLSTVTILTSRMKQELEEERKLREFIENELNVQREFLEHAETMVAESDQNAAKEKEAAKKARDAAKSIKAESRRYKALWRSIRTRLRDLEDCAATIQAEREQCKRLEESLMQDRRSAVEQEAYVSSLVDRVRSFARHMEELSEELSTTKSALERMMTDRVSLVDELTNVTTERDKLKDMLPLAESRKEELARELSKEREKLADVTAELQSCTIKMQEVNNLLKMSEAEKERLQSQYFKLDEDTRARIVISDQERHREAALAMTVERLEAQIEHYKAEKEHLKSLYEDEIKARETILKGTISVLEERLAEKNRELEMIKEAPVETVVKDDVIKAVQAALEEKSKTRAEEMMLLANQRLERLEQYTAKVNAPLEKMVAIEGQFELPQQVAVPNVDVEQPHAPKVQREVVINAKIRRPPS